MDGTQRIKLDTQTKKEKGFQAVISLLGAGIGIFNTLLLLLIIVFLVQVISKPTPSLVQTIEGESLAVKGVEGKHREDKVIKKFVQRIMTTAFTWDGHLVPETVEDVRNPIKDPGVEIKIKEGNKRVKIATSTYEASFAFNPDFQTSFLESIAPIFPESTLTTNKQTHLIIKDIHNPVPIDGKPFHWKVNMVATLVTWSGNNQITNPIPFNKEIYIRAVETPEYDEKIKEGNHYAQVIHEYRGAGLEIFDLREYKLDSLH